MNIKWMSVVLMAISTVAMATQDVQVETARVSGNLSVDILATGAAKTITYSDVKRQPMSKQAFLDAIQHGSTFIYKRDEAHASTAFILTSPNAHTKAAASAFNHAVHDNYKVSPGQMFPDFALDTLAGGRASSASLRGRPTLMQFFFAKCITCFVDNSALNAFASSHPQIGVLALTGNDARATKAYADQHLLAWPVAFGGQKVLDALGIKVFPAMALISADGRLLELGVSGKIAGSDGRVSEQDLDRWVREGLSGQQNGRVSESAVPTTPAAPAG